MRRNHGGELERLVYDRNKSVSLSVLSFVCAYRAMVMRFPGIIQSLHITTTGQGILHGQITYDGTMGSI
jgi:hypothetical protein